MDPIDFVDIIQVITQVLRAGAEYLVGFIIGAVFTAAMGLAVWRWSQKLRRWELERLSRELEIEKGSRETMRQMVDQLRAEGEARIGQLALKTHELEEARARSAQLEKSVEELRQALAKAQEARQAVEASLDQERAERARLVAELEQAHKEAADRERSLRQAVDSLRCQLEEEKAVYEARVRELQVVHERSLAELRLQCEELERSSAQALEEKHELEQQLDELRKHIDKLLEQVGEAWFQPARRRVPAFLPLATRRCPIIAVVNLKGGVGKTTMTAYVGTALASSGKRVLVVDLDYQASLTQLCLRPEHLPWSTEAGGGADRDSWIWVGRFLEDPEGNKTVGLERAIRADTLPHEQMWIWPAAEHLGDVENKLMLHFLIGRNNEGEIDQRYRLREILHQPELGQWFDIVLLDCPPRLTTACVNAIFAADYAWVPVKPDTTSTDAVPRLLRWIQKFREAGGENAPELLGLVFNEAWTHWRSETGVIRPHAEVMDQVILAAQDRWGKPVYRFSTIVTFHNDVARAAKDGGVSWDKLRTSRIWPFFENLASELLTRLDELGERVDETS